MSEWRLKAISDWHMSGLLQAAFTAARLALLRARNCDLAETSDLDKGFLDQIQVQTEQFIASCPAQRRASVLAALDVIIRCDGQRPEKNRRPAVRWAFAVVGGTAVRGMEGSVERYRWAGDVWLFWVDEAVSTPVLRSPLHSQQMLHSSRNT